MIFNGQSLGKRLLNLQVVNSENQSIKVSKSIIRSLILETPFFLNGALITYSSELTVLSTINTIIVFGGLFSIIYLYIFNKTTRQSLHDLIMGTYVVNSQVEKQNIGTIWKPHLIIVSIFMILITFSPFFFSTLVEENLYRFNNTARKIT